MLRGNSSLGTDMTPAAKSICYFASYPFLAGLSMIFAPALLLRILGFPVEGLDWIRMLGVVTTIVAYYYLRVGRSGFTPFFCWSVQMRSLIPLVFTTMVLMFGMNPIYVLLTLPDFFGALWTWRALHTEGINPFAAAS